MYFPMEFRFVAPPTRRRVISPFSPACELFDFAVHAAVGEPYDYLTSEIGPIFANTRAARTGAKLHDLGAAQLAALYPRWGDFLARGAELDPSTFERPPAQTV